MRLKLKFDMSTIENLSNFNFNLIRTQHKKLSKSSLIFSPSLNVSLFQTINVESEKVRKRGREGCERKLERAF
jgi:hypothetical protein